MLEGYEVLADVGARTRENVLGSTGAERTATPIGRAFQEASNALAWGGVWSRPGLVVRDRCLVTVATVTALGLTEVLPMHLQGAVRNGVTQDELVETLLHVGLYAGFPRASIAMRVAEGVVGEEAL
jgi:alkylhydroperoxidase/carboxymuconolactone decarboxylase family protein YurZ